MMKRIIFFVFMIFIASIQVNAEERLSFSNVKEAVDFISKCIDTNNASTLFEACIKDDNSLDNSYRKHIFDRLRDLNQETPLVELHSGKKFPLFKKTFKLGGHGFEWGHIHINFVKKDGKWYLYNIWQCK